MDLAQIFTQEHSKFIIDYNKSCVEQITTLLLSQKDALSTIVVMYKTSTNIAFNLELEMSDEQWKELMAIKSRLDSQLTIDSLSKKRKISDEDLLKNPMKKCEKKSNDDDDTKE